MVAIRIPTVWHKITEDGKVPKIGLQARRLILRNPRSLKNSPQFYTEGLDK